MDEIIKQVAERAGIGEEQARTAVTTVLGFLKERLPAPIAGHLDGVLGGADGGGDAAGGGLADMPGIVLDGLGDMFGKKG